MELQESLEEIVKELFDIKIDVILTRPEPQFGDFATNVALQLASSVGQNPRDIATQLADAISTKLSETVQEVSVAGPGFINLRLADSVLLKQLHDITKVPQIFAGQTIVAEYSDPNPFKVLHAGHLYTSVVGDAIANLLTAAGGDVHRVNFGGDVGLHVGKTMWAIIKELDGEHPEKLESISKDDRSTWLAQCYIDGTNAYEDSEEAKTEIVALNKKVYQFHSANDHESPLAQIYWTTRTWSYDYFDEFYARIGSAFEKYYPESQVADLGVKTVKEHVEKGVFEESDGAIIFKGEPYGLHTRVFINREGLPTYEAKDVGLIMQKKQDYDFDKSVVITGNEQEQYMAVVLKAIEQFAPELTKATSHLTHGLVKLKGGVKMSSRKGNILRATEVIDAAHEANDRKDESVTLGAIKYAFLKVRMGGDIIYDPQESVSLEGNSGPYLQYAHARARSILAKVNESERTVITELQPGERTLVSKLTEFSPVVAKATQELSPHIICTYLYELAQVFNRFYENNRVIGDEREAARLKLVDHYANVLRTGLGLLGITAPERM